MMAIIRFAYVMAVRRAVAGWRLEAVLFGGILLAVALMAGGVIFSILPRAGRRSGPGCWQVIPWPITRHRQRGPGPSLESRATSGSLLVSGIFGISGSAISSLSELSGSKYSR